MHNRHMWLAATALDSANIKHSIITGFLWVPDWRVPFSRLLAPSAPTCDVPQTCYMFELWRGLMATLEFPPHCSQHSFLFQLPSFNHPSLGDQKTECHQLTWRALLWSKEKKKGVVLPFLHHLSTDNFEHRLVLDAVQILVMQRDQETPGSCSDGIYILKGGRHNNI